MEWTFTFVLPTRRPTAPARPAAISPRAPYCRKFRPHSAATVATYPSLNWWVANELARANQKRLMWEHEFVEAAYGVTENQSIDATASTYPTTQRNAGYHVKFGIE